MAEELILEGISVPFVVLSRMDGSLKNHFYKKRWFKFQELHHLEVVKTCSFSERTSCTFEARFRNSECLYGMNKPPFTGLNNTFWPNRVELHLFSMLCRFHIVHLAHQSVSHHKEKQINLIALNTLPVLVLSCTACWHSLQQTCDSRLTLALQLLAPKLRGASAQCVKLLSLARLLQRPGLPAAQSLSWNSSFHFDSSMRHVTPGRWGILKGPSNWISNGN